MMGAINLLDWRCLRVLPIASDRCNRKVISGIACHFYLRACGKRYHSKEVSQAQWISMFEPVELNDIMISVIAGASVVLFGALYALIFALGRLSGNESLARAAYVFFAMLAVAALVLADTLHLTGFWQLITLVILGGYLFAPHAIWKLCVGTHPERPSSREASASGEIHE
jgi:hypothetical protein